MNSKSLSFMFSSSSDEWSTPLNLFNNLDHNFHFDLDPCASESNHKCPLYFTKADNGLEKSWAGHVVFCNPPYSDVKAWAKKCFEEYFYNHTYIVLLVPARTDTAWFHDFVYPYAVLRFIRGRLSFNNKGRAPFPSMICVFDPHNLEV